MFQAGLISFHFQLFSEATGKAYLKKRLIVKRQTILVPNLI